MIESCRKKYTFVKYLRFQNPVEGIFDIDFNIKMVNLQKNARFAGVFCFCYAITTAMPFSTSCSTVLYFTFSLIEPS
jgi:hypothetical protein